MAEHRYQAVMAVIDGLSISQVAHKVGVSRQTLHAWLARGAAAVPSESAVYRALVRAGTIDAVRRDQRARKWKRRERGAPMELWQLDVVSGFPLADASGTIP